MSAGGPPRLDNPFPGPQPYRASDRDRFHGRDGVARELTSTVLAHRCVALFGPSGAGKSSVMQAAVLPALAEDHDFRVVAIDGWPPNESPVSWLLEVLLRDLKLAPSASPLSLFESVEWIVDQAFYRSDRPVLIVLDQIEQLLFAQRDADEVADFLDWLDRFAGQPLRGLHLVLAMREDYLGRFRDRARGRHRLLENGFRLGPLTVGEITGAVVKAAADGSPPQSWSASAMRRLMLQVRVPGQSERDDAEVQTAFAQIVCRALFAQRAASDAEHDSEEPIEAEPILQNYLVGALAALGTLRSHAEQLLEDHLVANDGTRTLLTEEAARASSSAGDEELNAILTNLERAAILRAEQHRGTRYFELGHDWLAKRVFDRKQERLARAEEEAREAERLAEQRAAEEALDRARAETRRARRVIAVVTAFGLLAAVLGVVAWFQREAAIAAEEAVRAERDRANEILETAKNITRELLLEALPKYEDIPGTADVQREIHERLKTILTTLRDDAGDDPEVVHLEIQQKLKRGKLALTHERLDDAREEFSQALSLAERFTAEHPEDPQARRDLSISLNELGYMEALAGDLDAARGRYSRSLKISEALAASASSNTQAQRDLIVVLVGLGVVEAKAGDLTATRIHYSRALKIAEALTAADPRNARFQQTQVSVLRRLGTLEEYSGNLTAARSHYDSSLKIAEALAAADPTSVQAQRDLSISLEKLGNVEVDSGNITAARGHYERSLTTNEALATADPTSSWAQQNFSISLLRLGDVELQAGNLIAARDHYERSLEVAEAVLTADPTSAVARNSLSMSQNSLAYVEVQEGNLTAARGHYERSLAVREELAAANPTNAQAQRDLSITLNKLGDVEVQAGNLAAARSHFDRALKVALGLATADPTSAQAQRDLSISLNKHGDVEVQAGNLAAARGHYDRSLELTEARAAADPTNTLAQRDLAYCLDRLGEVEVQAGNLAAARGHLARARTTLDALVKTTPDDSAASFELVEVHLALLDLSRKEKDREARLEHLVAAGALLDAMAARGQVAGNKDREAAKRRVTKELAALSR